jgi:hypothetical protein
MSGAGNALGSGLVDGAMPHHIGDRPLLPVPDLGLGERLRSGTDQANPAGQPDPGGDAEFGGKGARVVIHHVLLIESAATPAGVAF